MCPVPGPRGAHHESRRQAQARQDDVLAKANPSAGVTQPEGMRAGFLEEEVLNYSFKVSVGSMRPKKEGESESPARVLSERGKLEIARGLVNRKGIHGCPSGLERVLGRWKWLHRNAQEN